jgi:hypothetical protein
MSSSGNRNVEWWFFGWFNGGGFFKHPYVLFASSAISNQPAILRQIYILSWQIISASICIHDGLHD